MVHAPVGIVTVAMFTMQQLMGSTRHGVEFNCLMQRNRQPGLPLLNSGRTAAGWPRPIRLLKNLY
jgi:hypothetical protein